MLPTVVSIAIAVGFYGCVSLSNVAPFSAVVLVMPSLGLSVMLLFLAVVGGVMVAPAPTRPNPLDPLLCGDILVSSFLWGVVSAMSLLLSAVAMAVCVLPAAIVWLWVATVCWESFLWLLSVIVLLVSQVVLVIVVIATCFSCHFLLPVSRVQARVCLA